MNTPPLERQLITRVAAVVVLALGVAGLVTYELYRRSLETQLAEVLDERAAIVEAFAREESDHVQLAQVLGDRGLRVEVHAPDGTVHASEPLLPRVGTNLPAGGTMSQSLTRRVDLPAGGHAVVAVSRDGVATALRRLEQLLAAVGAIIAVLAVTVIAWTTARGLRPIGYMAAVADAITAGDRTRRLNPVRLDTALGRLGASFDQMLDRLDDAVGDARRAEAAERRFLADAAHQLRTPITRISATAQTLALAPPQRRDELAATIAAEARRCGELVTRLLRLAQLEHTGTMRLHPVDVAELCRQEADRAQDLAPHLTVNYIGDHPSLLALGDSASLHDAVANLLDNARRHADNNITVEVRADTDDVQIRISDDGPGMTPVDAAQAFQPFTSLDRHNGSGLGIPIAQASAQAQGGDLSYEPPVFILRLPAHGGPHDIAEII